ncbi:MAG: plasmid stabilization protein [Gammaproteobacteria bacterium]|nr:plasmid stabilization protein [Gammaproteobacteria bacterium]
MASITIHNLDDAVKTKLRIRAADHGHSIEEEARMILTQTIYREDDLTNPAQAAREKLAAMGLSETDIAEAVTWARSMTSTSHP